MDINNNNMNWNNDYVFYKGEDGKMYGGGFCIENILNKMGGGQQLITLNESQYGGGSNNNNNNNNECNKELQFSDIFKSYAVPSGLFSFPYKNLQSLNKVVDTDDIINDDLYKKLLDLVSEKNIKGVGKKTRRVKIKIIKGKKGTQRVLE
jgi:hypothetical protein